MGKDTILLSTDTSETKFSIALLGKSGLADEFVSGLNGMASSGLLPEIDRLLRKNSYTIEDIDAYCTGMGPGSFTGLRVGLTTVKTLAMVFGRRIVGVPSIDGLAHNLSGYKGQICALIDARQKMVYARFYAVRNKAIRPRTKYLLLNIRDLLEKVKEETCFLGNGIGPYRDEISKRLGRLAKFAPEALWYPRASIIGRLGMKRLKAGRHDNIYKLSPLYIYPKECQIRKKAKA